MSFIRAKEIEGGEKMNKCSGDCVYDYYESDTNYGECQHPDFDIEKPDHCPGYLSKEQAKADAKYSHKDKY